MAEGVSCLQLKPFECHTCKLKRTTDEEAVQICREWTDGVLTACVRKAARAAAEQQVWIVCDGDIDPEWIETLNSVLDDNRLLTMPNGERVQLNRNVNLFFECSSLQFASPATVSRCAVICTTDEAEHSGSTRDSGGPTRMIAARVAASMHRVQAANRDAAVWTMEKLPLALEWLQAHPNAAALPAPLSAAAAAAADALAGLQQHQSLKLEAQTPNDANELNDCSRTGMPGTPVAALRAIAASLLPTSQAREAFISAAEQHAWCHPWPKSSLMSAQSNEEPQRALAAVTASDLPAHSHFSAYDSPLKGVVISEELQGALVVVAPWFNACRPFVIVGPSGSGKRTLLDTAIAAMPGVKRADMACNSHTQAEHVIQKLIQVTPDNLLISTGNLKALHNACAAHHKHGLSFKHLWYGWTLNCNVLHVGVWKSRNNWRRQGDAAARLQAPHLGAAQS